MKDLCCILQGETPSPCVKNTKTHLLNLSWFQSMLYFLALPLGVERGLTESLIRVEPKCEVLKNGERVHHTGPTRAKPGQCCNLPDTDTATHRTVAADRGGGPKQIRTVLKERSCQSPFCLRWAGTGHFSTQPPLAPSSTRLTGTLLGRPAMIHSPP